MRSWSAFGMVVGVLAFGAASADAETAPSRSAGAAATSWTWELPAIGRLGPLGTSNALYSVAVHGGAAVSESKASSTGTAKDKDDDDNRGTTYAIIGGSAIGVGLFIAAVSGGSSDALTNPNNGGDSPFTPGGDTGGNTGGNNGDTGGPGGVSGDTGNPAPGGPGGSIGGPTTVTPEPASMALIASGLAGMGGIQFRRNRKRAAEK